MLKVSVVFKSNLDGKEQTYIINDLISVPGTGDIIEGPYETDPKYKVKSVVHQGVLSSPGEHTIIVHLEKA